MSGLAFGPVQDVRGARGADVRLAEFIPSRRIGTLAELSGVHFLADGSLGFGWQMGVPAAESLDGAEETLANAYDKLLRALSEGYSLDLFIGRDRNVERYIAAYDIKASEHPLCRELMAQAVSRWRAAQERGFFPDVPEVNFFPRRQTITLFLKSPPQPALTRNSARALFAWIKHGAAHAIDEDIHRVGVDFRRRVAQIAQTAASSGLDLRPLTGNDYIAVVASLLFPQNLQAASIDLTERDAAGDAVAALGDVPHIGFEGFVTAHRGRRVWHQAVSMMWQPGAVFPGMLGALVNDESDITVCLSYTAKGRNATLLRIKTARHMNEKLTVGFNQIEMDKRAEALDAVQSRMHDGETMGATRLMVWVRGESVDDTADRAVRVIGHLDQHMPADLETTIGSSALLSALPMARSDVADRATSRARRMLSSDVAAMAPLSGYWEGTDPQRSIALYASRWGTPFFLDPRACDTNPHLLVVGGSGSGKTFWVQDFLTQLYCVPDLRVFLLSIKPDYERLARLLGKYVEIQLDGDDAINGFRGAPTYDNLSGWLAILVNMLTDTDPRLVVDKEAQGCLSESALRASRRNWDDARNQPMRETVLGDIVQQLEHTSLGRDLAKRLQPYTRGAYARLFNRPNTVEIDDRFVFFNLSKVVDYPCAGVLSLCVFNFINNIMYDPQHLGSLKVLGLDEGWALMRDDGSAMLVQKAFRAYRSLNGMAFAISQLMSDFDTPMGKAILGNTATKIVLRQDRVALQALPKYVALSEKEHELVSSLNVRKGLFSEFFAKMEGRPSTVARVIPDPLKYAIATTDPADSALYQKLLADCGGDHAMAVGRFAKEFPYGGRRAL